MTNFITAFAQLKLGTNAQIKVALDQLKESGQTTSVAYVDLAKSKVEDAWKFVEELLVSVADSEQRALDAENKNKSLSSDVITLEHRNNELEAQMAQLEEKLTLSRTSNNQLSNELSEVNQQLQQVTRERNQERGKAANLQGQVNKFADVQKELADLKALNPQQLKAERY